MEKYFLVVLLTCAAIVSAGTSAWDGSDGDWMDPIHWSGDDGYLIPGWVTDNPNNDGTWESNSNKSYASIEGGTAHITDVSFPDGRVERIYVKGGTLDTSGDYYVYRFHVGDVSGSTGTVTQTAGSATVRKLYIAQNDGSASYTISDGSLEVYEEAKIGNGGTAFLNQNGGSVTISAGTLYLNSVADYIATYNLTDGTFSAERIKVGENDGTGEINISGGSFTVNKYMSVYSGSDSTFRVIGSDATSITLAQLAIYDETLAVELDADGSTLIEVTGTESDSYKGANLTGAMLAVETLADFDGTAGDIYDLLWSATTIDVTDLGLSNLSSTQFTYSVVDDTLRGGQVLQLTVVPEPVTIALLLAGGLFLKRRK